MKPCFDVGQVVRYWNHVVGYDIYDLLILRVVDGIITGVNKYGPRREFTFTLDGVATHSSNLSIKHKTR